MKTWKKFGAALCVMTLAFSLAACGGEEKPKGETGGKPEDIAQVLATANTKMETVESMQADMSMDMNLTISAEGESYEMTTKTNMKMAMFNKPIKLKMDMAMEMGGNMPGAEDGQTVNMSMYIMEKDGVYTMYANDGTNWGSQPIDIADIEEYDPQENMSLYLNSSDGFKADGEETIQGQKAKKYTGKITNEAMNEVMDASGVADSMGGAMNMDGIDWEAMYTDMGDMPVSIWINEEGYPVRYEMDMTKIMNTVFTKMMEQMGEDAAGGTITCDKVLMVMECYDYNNVKDFELPAEALA